MTTVLVTVCVFGVCSMFVVWACVRAYPIDWEEEERPSKVDRINRIIAVAKHHNEHLEALADEFVQIHGYEWGTLEAKDLSEVIFFGQDYERAMESIMRLKRLREAE